MRQSHIVFCANSAWNLYNFRLPLMKSLAEQGFKVSAVAPVDEYEARIRSAGFEFHALSLSRKSTNLLTDLKTLRALQKLYKKLVPDVVCHFTIKPNIYGTVAAAKLGIPAVNNISGLGTVFITHSPVTTLVKLLYRFSQKKASKVFFQNSDDQREFIQHALVPAEISAVLPGSGIDLNHYSVEKSEERESKVRSMCRFLLVGRILRDKGVLEYFDAAKIITAERRDARFMLLGPIDEHNHTGIDHITLEALLQPGAVEYRGETEDVRSFIEAADCVVLPSYREGTPRTLLEAAAMGKPLITTDVPGCRQVVEDGVNGYLCKPYSSESLAGSVRKILQLAPQERRQMGLKGREKMEREYDQQLVLEAYRRAIEEALA